MLKNALYSLAGVALAAGYTAFAQHPINYEIIPPLMELFHSQQTRLRLANATEPMRPPAFWQLLRYIGVARLCFVLISMPALSARSRKGIDTLTN